MYQQLPEFAPEREAPPPLHSPMAAVLGLLLRVLNAAFAICALGLLGCSVYMDWQYAHHHAGPPGPQPSPSPSPEPSPEPEPSPPLAAALGSALAAQRAQQAPLVVEVLAAGLREAAVAAYPWFIYAVGATGAYLLLAAMVGVSGVQRGSRWRLAVYIGLLSLLILMEAGVLLLLFTNNAWRQRIPGDPSGYWERAQQFSERNAAAVKLACLAVMGAELVALGAASWLHSLQQVAYETWLDDREEAERRERRVLEQAVRRQYTGGSSSLWTQRMQQRYGVDQTQVACESAAVRQVAALSGDVPAPAPPAGPTV